MSLPKDPVKLAEWLSKQKPRVQKKWSNPAKLAALWEKCSHEQPKGKDSPRWKGDEIKYNSAHLLVAKLKPKPDSCTKCGVIKERLELANLSGIYNRDPENYIWLCTKCHRKMDGHSYKKMKPETRYDSFYNQYHQEQSALLPVLEENP